MADPILVNQIISSLGLSGKDAEQKRTELEKLSNDELNKMLANRSDFKKVDVGSFSALSQIDTQKPEAVWGTDLQGYTVGLERQSTPESPKKLSAGKEKEMRTFAADYLSDAANGAKESFTAYRNGVGYISADAVWHGLKNISDWTLKLNDKINPISIGYKHLTGKETADSVTTLNEQEELIKKAQDSAQKLDALKDGRKASFEIEFERQRGKSFDPVKVEKFQTHAQTYVEMTAAHDRYQMLASGFSDVKTILRQEQEYEQARKTVKGPAAAQLEAPKVSSHQKFGEVLMQFCGGNKELYDNYMKGLSEEYKTPQEINKHLPEIMQKLQTKAEKETNRILKGKSYETYTQEYQNAFKDTFGNEDIQELTNGWIETQRTGSEYTKMAITLAATVMLGNSTSAAKFAQGIAARSGTATAGTAMKAMFTFGAPALNMSMDYASALTSKDGLTAERNSQILQGAVQSLPYTIFGSYASGPLGDAVKAYCKSAPSFIPNILNKAFASAPKAASAAGLGVEITADTVFACAMEDMSFTDALSREGSTDTGMRVASKVMTAFIGGRAHGASKQVMAEVQENLKDYKIAEVKNPNGTVNYKLTTPEGKTVVTDGEGLMSGIFAAAGGVAEKGAVDEKALIRKRMRTNPQDVMTKKYTEKVGLKVDSDSPETGFPKAPFKYDIPSKETIDVIKHLDPKVMTKRYENMGKVYEQISKTRNADIEKINTLYKTDRQKAAEEFSKLLAEELGTDLPAVPVRFSDKGENAFDWTKGEIVLGLEIKTSTDMMEIMSHEHVHMLQFRDILAANGEDGVAALFAQNEKKRAEYTNFIKENLSKEDFESLDKGDMEYLVFEAAKNTDADSVLNNAFTQKLLKNAKDNPISKGTVDGYMAQIYKDSFANDQSENGIKEYLAQATEAEAYFLGSNKIGKTITSKIKNAEVNFERTKDNSSANTLAPKGKLSSEDPRPSIFGKIKIALTKQKIMIQEYKGLRNKSRFEGKNLKRFLNEVYCKRPDLDISKLPDLATMSKAETNFMINLCTNRNFNTRIIRGIIQIKYDKYLNRLINFLNVSIEKGLTKEQAASIVQQLDVKRTPYNYWTEHKHNIYRYQEMRGRSVDGLLLENIDTFKNLDTSQLKDIYDLFHFATDSKNPHELQFKDQKAMRTLLDGLPQETKEIWTKRDIDVLGFEEKLNNVLKQNPNIKPSKENQKTFLSNIIANNNPKSELVFKNADLTPFKTNGIPLKYPRSAFNNNISSILKKLPPNEQKALLLHFNLSIKNGVVEGIHSFNKAKELPFKDETKEAALKIEKELKKYYLENETIINDKDLKKVFDSLVKGLPEFANICGKPNPGHENTIDFHTLEVLQNAMKDENYKNLSDKDKTVLKFSIITHDMGKQNDVSDNGAHSFQSAKYSHALLDKFNLSLDVKERITNMVLNHHWLQNSDDYYPAQLFRNPADREVAAILTAADVKSSIGAGNPNASSKTLKSKLDSDKNILYDYSTTNTFFSSKNTMAAAKYPKASVEIDGQTVEIPILELSKISNDEDLSKYGYPPGTKKTDLAGFVHMVKYPQSIQTIIDTYRMPEYELNLSVTPAQYGEQISTHYGLYGVILSPNNYNVGGMATYTAYTGFEKNFNTFVNPPSEYKSGINTRMKDKMKTEGIGYDTREKIVNYLQNKNYKTQISDIEVDGQKFSKDYLLGLYEEAAKDFYYGETNLYKPMIEQIIVPQNIKPEEIPVDLLRLAHKNNIPIIITGTNKQ